MSNKQQAEAAVRAVHSPIKQFLALVDSGTVRMSGVDSGTVRMLHADAKRLVRMASEATNQAARSS